MNVLNVSRWTAILITTTLGCASEQAAQRSGPTMTSESSGPADAAGVRKHLMEHQKYPATKAELVAECNNLMDFSDADKKWFSETLPEGTYNSADEVVKALGLSSGPMDAANVKQHLMEHQKYPATKAELVAECNALMDFSDADKKWFADTLPDRTYASAEEVTEALGIQ